MHIRTQENGQWNTGKSIHVCFFPCETMSEKSKYGRNIGRITSWSKSRFTARLADIGSCSNIPSTECFPSELVSPHLQPSPAQPRISPQHAVLCSAWLGLAWLSHSRLQLATRTSVHPPPGLRGLAEPSPGSRDSSTRCLAPRPRYSAFSPSTPTTTPP